MARDLEAKAGCLLPSVGRLGIGVYGSRTPANTWLEDQYVSTIDPNGTAELRLKLGVERRSPQQGEGCDYTIGCGMAYRFVEAETYADAVGQIIYPDGEDEGSVLEDDKARVEILIAPAEAVASLDWDEILDRIESGKQAADDASTETDERAELARLKAKYND